VVQAKVVQVSNGQVYVKLTPKNRPKPLEGFHYDLKVNDTVNTERAYYGDVFINVFYKRVY
jgi:hypothetical protein